MGDGVLAMRHTCNLRPNYSKRLLSSLYSTASMRSPGVLLRAPRITCCCRNTSLPQHMHLYGLLPGKSRM